MPAQPGDQPLALLLQRHLGEAALGHVVPVHDQVRPGQREQLVEAGRVVGVLGPGPGPLRRARPVGRAVGDEVGRQLVGRAPAPARGAARTAACPIVSSSSQSRASSTARASLALCLPVAGGRLRLGQPGPQPAYLGVVVGGGPGRPALLGGQQVAGPLLRGLRLAQRLGRWPAPPRAAGPAPRGPGPARRAACRPPPGPPRGRARRGRRAARRRGPGSATAALSASARTASTGRLDQLAPAVRPGQVGERGDLDRVGGGRRHAARRRRRPGHRRRSPPGCRSAAGTAGRRRAGRRWRRPPRRARRLGANRATRRSGTGISSAGMPGSAAAASVVTRWRTGSGQGRLRAARHRSSVQSAASSAGRSSDGSGRGHESILPPCGRRTAGGRK